ncbi:MAG: hypothetical protein KC613_16030, partial [Myxococcales bacterium]|nr:hypothetical protein [Myxococcales bacterium]
MSAPVMGGERGYWNAYVAGVVLGIVLTAAFVLTGGGLGGSGGLARITAELTATVAPDYARAHPTLAPWVGGSNGSWGHPMVFMTLGLLAGGLA